MARLSFGDEILPVRAVLGSVSLRLVGWPSRPKAVDHAVDSVQSGRVDSARS